MEYAKVCIGTVNERGRQRLSRLKGLVFEPGAGKLKNCYLVWQIEKAQYGGQSVESYAQSNYKGD